MLAIIHDEYAFVAIILFYMIQVDDVLPVHTQKMTFFQNILYIFERFGNGKYTFIG